LDALNDEKHHGFDEEFKHREQQKITIKEAFDYLMIIIAQSKNKFIIDSKTVRKLRRTAKKFSVKCIKEIDKSDSQNLYGERYVTPAPYDPAGLFKYFPCLRLKKGFHVDSYLTGGYSSSRTGGEGFVYILPDGYKLPMPESAELDEQLLDFLTERTDDSISPLPEWAHEDVGSFLEGDGSPLSYFQASMFVRDLRELGAFWHGLTWGVERVLSSSRKIPKNEDWTWHESKPAPWLPIVWQDEDNGWNVVFYTHDTMNAKIIFNCDLYRGGYDFIPFCFTIASSSYRAVF
jgi:hypothetical protein